MQRFFYSKRHSKSHLPQVSNSLQPVSIFLVETCSKSCELSLIFSIDQQINHFFRCVYSFVVSLFCNLPKQTYEPRLKYVTCLFIGDLYNFDLRPVVDGLQFECSSNHCKTVMSNFSIRSCKTKQNEIKQD